MNGHQIFVKCAWRLIPFMVLLYFVSFIDRTNVSFAALTMNEDLGFSPAVFAKGNCANSGHRSKAGGLAERAAIG